MTRQHLTNALYCLIILPLSFCSCGLSDWVSPPFFSLPRSYRPSDHGPIYALSWNAAYLAWSDDSGVRVASATGEKVAFIKRENPDLRPDLFRCCLTWKDPHTLVIGWGDYIKVARIAKSGATVLAILQLDAMIAGISTFDGNFVVLCYTTEDTFTNEDTENRDEQKRRDVATRPELRLISPDGDELASDAISIRYFERYQCRDYKLADGGSPGEFYVLSPRDVVYVQPRDLSDHVQYLLDAQKYPDAIAIITEERAKLPTFDLYTVQKEYLDFLISGGEFDTAARLAHDILTSAGPWEDLIFIYADRNRLDTIIPFVPVATPQLSSLAYELILAYLIEHDSVSLLEHVRNYPPEIYDVNAVVVVVESRLEKAEDRSLMEALCELYMHAHTPAKAIPYYLRLNRGDVFDLIETHSLFPEVKDSVQELVAFGRQFTSFASEAGAGGRRGGEGGDDRGGALAIASHTHERKPATFYDPPSDPGLLTPPDQPVNPALALLIAHTDEIPTEAVVAQLRHDKPDLYVYLDALFAKDPRLAVDYADLQVELYAEFDTSRLLPFLRSSDLYDAKSALKICEGRPELLDEEVFLLGKMGEASKALRVLISRGTEDQSIAFVKEQNSSALWNELLSYSEDAPLLMRALLLESVRDDTVVAPVKLMKRIKRGLEIPELKSLLITILQDMQLQVSIVDGCYQIVYRDCTLAARKLRERQTHAFTADRQLTSSLSHAAVFAGDGDIALHFLCGHTFGLRELGKGGDVLPTDFGDTQSKLEWLARFKRENAVECLLCE